MNDLDKQIDEILRNYIVLATDNGQPYIKYTEDATQTIKQLFQELIDEVIGKWDYCNSDGNFVAHDGRPTYTDERNILMKEQRQRAKELLEKL